MCNNATQSEYMCINIGIWGNLIHITWLTELESCLAGQEAITGLMWDQSATLKRTGWLNWRHLSFSIGQQLRRGKKGCWLGGKALLNKSISVSRQTPAAERERERDATWQVLWMKVQETQRDAACTFGFQSNLGFAMSHTVHELYVHPKMNLKHISYTRVACTTHLNIV